MIAAAFVSGNQERQGGLVDRVRQGGLVDRVIESLKLQIRANGLAPGDPLPSENALSTELGVSLARLGHEVHFVTYKQPFRLPPFTPRVYFHEVDVGRGHHP